MQAALRAVLFRIFFEIREMNMKTFHSIAAVVLLVLALSGCSHLKGNRDVLFQTSTITALLEGVYDGNMTFGELRRRGDTGIGTFDGLDGEMLGFNGEFYQIKADGLAYPVDDSMKTPFAAVTFFEADKSVFLENFPDYKSLEEYLDGQLPTKNLIYVVKIEGSFSYIKTRSVPRQNKPYPPLVEVVKNQPLFEFRNVRGTLIGFRLPEFTKGINVPGYHLHFITEDRKGGGHLLECSIEKAKAEIDYTPEFYMTLPEDAQFYGADLTKEKQKDLEKVEK